MLQRVGFAEAGAQSMIDSQQAMAILAAADLVHSADVVASAVGRVARAISDKLHHTHPVLLCVMNGGVPFAGHLMTRLTFPLDFDYLHVTRYGFETTGGHLVWRNEPSLALRGRTVLVVDDILDAGVTLAAICERLWQLGVAKCYTAVVAEKMTGLPKPMVADFVALSVPNRFVFGYGMDVQGAWRNLPAIYALREG